MSLGLNCTASHVDVLTRSPGSCKEASRQKLNIPPPNDCFSAKKKQKRNFIQKTRKHLQTLSSNCSSSITSVVSSITSSKDAFTWALFVVSERLLATGCLFWALQAELHNHPSRNSLPFWAWQAELHNHPKSRIFNWHLPQSVLNIGLIFEFGSQLLSLYIRRVPIRDYGYLLFR